MMKFMLAVLLTVCSCQQIVQQNTYEATINPQPCPIDGNPLLSLAYNSPRNCSATFCNFRPFPYEKDFKEDCSLASGTQLPASYPDRLNFVKFRYFIGTTKCVSLNNDYDGQIGIYEDKCTPDAFNQGVTFMATCATPGVAATILICPPNSLDCTNCQSYNVLADGQCHSFVDPGFPPGLPDTDPNGQAQVTVPLTPDGNNTFIMSSYIMTCPKRYRKLSFWTDLPNCDVAPFPNTEMMRRISHLNENGCDTSIPPQRCDSFPLNDPDPLHAYGRKLNCHQEFSEYTPPPGYAMLQMWCNDPDCPQGDTPDIMRAVEPGKCSGASDLAGEVDANGQQQTVLPIIIDCVNRVVSYFSNSDCSSTPVATYSLAGPNVCVNPSSPITQENGCSIFSAKLICPQTSSPTNTPTSSPTVNPTPLPTRNPTRLPTRVPTNLPTRLPTRAPTKAPTVSPTTAAPSKSPTTPWHGDVTCVKGICNCDNAENCYCRGKAKDCMCQQSRNCFCENVSGFCFGGNAQNVWVEVGNNIDCELAENCIIKTLPPNATSGAASVVVSALVLLAFVLSL